MDINEKSNNEKIDTFIESLKNLKSDKAVFDEFAKILNGGITNDEIFEVLEEISDSNINITLEMIDAAVASRY